MTVSKQELRESMSVRREALVLTEVLRASHMVCAQLFMLPEVSAAPRLAIYAACTGEIDLGEVYQKRKQQGKPVLLPRYRPDTGQYEMVEIRDWEKDTGRGRYGIREPLAVMPGLPDKDLRNRDLTWLVPGLAFDRQGHRLGRGGGYYDRMLRDTAGLKIGIAYDWQIVSEVPTSAADVNVDVVITETRILRCALRDKSTAAA